MAPLYLLGIDEKHLDLYYVLPLIKFSLLPNGLMLRVSIPLQTINTKTLFNLLKAIASPIPCSEKFCQWFGRLNCTDTFMTLSLKDRSWLTGEDNINLYGEIDLSSFSCITISGENLCYTMDPSLIQTISACIISLWNWDTNYVKKFCQFELSLKEQYQPIRITEDTWILHKDVIPSYDVICENIGSKGRTLVEWAEEVTVDTSCYLKTESRILYGPLKYRDSRLDLVRSKPPIFLFDQKFFNPEEKIEEQVIKVKREKSEDKKSIDVNKYRDYLQLDQRATTAAMDMLWTTSEDFSERLIQIENIQQHTINSVTWQGLVHSVTKIIMFYIFTSVSITLIRLGQSIIGITPIIVLNAQFTDALISSSKNSITYWETVVHDPINPIINLILIILGFITSVGVIKYKWFKILRFSPRRFRFEDENEFKDFTNYEDYVQISFNLLTKHWFSAQLREVIIRCPIDCLDHSISFGHIYVKGHLKIWFIHKENKGLKFKLASPIQFSVDLQQGAETARFQRIDFSIAMINWIEGGFPKGLGKSCIYGNCLVKFVRGRSTSIRNAD